MSSTGLLPFSLSSSISSMVTHHITLISSNRCLLHRWLLHSQTQLLMVSHKRSLACHHSMCTVARRCNSQLSPCIRHLHLVSNSTHSISRGGTCHYNISLSLCAMLCLTVLLGFSHMLLIQYPVSLKFSIHSCQHFQQAGLRAVRSRLG